MKSVDRSGTGRAASEAPLCRRVGRFPRQQFIDPHEQYGDLRSYWGQFLDSLMGKVKDVV
ncbi:MAG: hypothetical protein ACREHD_12495 [Pirellulales bacterium]